MKITYFGYNSFVIEEADISIAIDPGASFYIPDFFKTIIPIDRWHALTHILVTHGDPDHYWHTDRVAKASGAFIVCNDTIIKGDQMIGPRKKDVGLVKKLENTVGISVGESKEVGTLKIQGIKTVHGPLNIKIGPFKKTVRPGPDERIGYGAIGFQFELHGLSFVNLGDTLLMKDDWIDIKKPDVLMIPIGGESAGNTMTTEEALIAVQSIEPGLVIPCHYNCGGFFSKCYNPVDGDLFKTKVEEMGFKCSILKPGEQLILK
ncbi:MAG: MBL fold metallo-hydrolase [Clostridiales bacterium]|nr:MBL fold metallo-hydrolase [Clostridiales bacterium]